MAATSRPSCSVARAGRVSPRIARRFVRVGCLTTRSTGGRKSWKQTSRSMRLPEIRPWAACLREPSRLKQARGRPLLGERVLRLGRRTQRAEIPRKRRRFGRRGPLEFVLAGLRAPGSRLRVSFPSPMPRERSITVGSPLTVAAKRPSAGPIPERSTLSPFSSLSAALNCWVSTHLLLPPSLAQTRFHG